MRVLVLGANGQLGKVIVNKLAADGHQITGFLRHLPSEIASGAHIEYFVGDATNEKSVAESLSGRDVGSERDWQTLSPAGRLSNIALRSIRILDLKIRRFRWPNSFLPFGERTNEVWVRFLVEQSYEFKQVTVRIPKIKLCRRHPPNH